MDVSKVLSPLVSPPTAVSLAGESKGCELIVADSASGFTIADLEFNPSAFFADTHTAQYTAGAIRGQLRMVKPTWDYKEEDKKY